MNGPVRIQPALQNQIALVTGAARGGAVNGEIDADLTVIINGSPAPSDPVSC